MNNIKEVAEGRLAIKNDGTLEELREALVKCFLEDPMVSRGQHSFYRKNNGNSSWGAYHQLDTPHISVKDLLEWTPVRGEMVLVRFNNESEWRPRIFVVNIEGAINSCFFVDKGHEDQFNKGEPFRVIHWDYMKRKEESVTEMTIEQLEDKYSITNLKIVKR